MVTASGLRGPGDVVLTAGGVAYPLRLLRDEKGRQRYRRELLPGLAPVVRSSGAVDLLSLPGSVQEVGVDLSDLGGGFGAYDHQAGHYFDASGVDCSVPGQMTPGPFFGTSAKNPVGALNGAIACSTVAQNGTVLIGAGQRVYSWDGTDWIEVDNCGAAVKDLVSYGVYVAAALGSSTPYRFSGTYGAAGTWVSSTLANKWADYFAVAQDGATTLTVWMVIAGASVAPTGAALRYSTDISNAGSWTHSALVGDSDEAFTSLRAPGGGRTLLIGKARSLYRRDSSGNLALVLGGRRASTGAGAANFARGAELGTDVFYPVEDYGICRVDQDGNVKLGFEPAAQGPGVSRAQAAVVGLAGDGRALWCALAGASGYLYKGGYASSDAVAAGGAPEHVHATDTAQVFVWHGAVSAVGVALGFLFTAESPAPNPYRYLWACRSATDFTPLRARLARTVNPLNDADYRFVTDGVLFFGRFNGGVRDGVKVFRRWAFQSENLGVASRKLTLQWQADAGGWSAAVDVTVSPDATVFPGLVEYRRLELSVTLVSGTGSSSGYATTAVLRGQVHRSVHRPVRRYGYEFTAEIADVLPSGSGGLEMVDRRARLLALFNALEGAAPFTFQDRDGVSWWAICEEARLEEVDEAAPGQIATSGRVDSALRVSLVTVPASAADE